MSKRACRCCRPVSSRPRLWLLLALLSAMLAAGCAPLYYPAAPPLATHLPVRDQAGDCARYFAALDKAVEEAGVADRQARRIPGFPYLRVNRFLASYSNRDLEEKPAMDAWTDRMLALDREARKAEIANLPEALRKGLYDSAGQPDLRQRVATCGELLRNIDLESADNRKLLRTRASVPPNYSTAKSVLGIYPLTSLFIRLGIARYRRSVRETNRIELDRLPITGHLVRYLPPAGDTPAAKAETILQRAARNPLGIPELKVAEQRRLFLAFAPVWEIDVGGDFDRPGTPNWDDGRLPEVVPGMPRVYTLLSFTRFRGEVLLQLNYVIWFSERPLAGIFDILGGRLDGLIWRVTLDRQGAPLIYDSIHNCGCYHKFFPGPDLTARKQKAVSSEPILVPQQAPELVGDQKMVIRVASRTHYIDRVYADRQRTGEENVTYDLTDYNILRSLPTPEGHRSLFGPDALVPGSERGERWLLWPTGVSSPGAMRQWGNHATAFFGRRHFDDPDLLERLFAPQNPAAQ
ncbi:MAG: hypothetical protein P8130_11050 [Deltaproteobacteria bacterium]